MKKTTKKIEETKSEFNKKVIKASIRLYIQVAPEANLPMLGTLRKQWGRKYTVTGAMDEFDEDGKKIGVGVYGIEQKILNKMINELDESDEVLQGIK
jgi:hypothetical protein